MHLILEHFKDDIVTILAAREMPGPVRQPADRVSGRYYLIRSRLLPSVGSSGCCLFVPLRIEEIEKWVETTVPATQGHSLYI